MSDLSFFQNPASVAVIGASNDSEKIGGRPIRYMQEFGFSGAIYPINPSRATVQDLPAFASLDDLPSVPDVVLIAISGQSAVDQVMKCAELGVKGCIIMASGFGETGEDQGKAWQQEMLDAAAQSGMRLIGPNSHGLASFSNGAVLGFSTLFTEQAPADGPVAVVSQSGAMCSVAYGLLRKAGIGVRYAHGTGNDIDVTASELAIEAVRDPDIKLLIMYLEDIRDRDAIVRLAQEALLNDVPIVVLMGGRSEEGKRAAASHTGALANEQRVVDAFFESLGIWRASSTRELVAATQFYLKSWRPRGHQLAIVSNSGAVCVLAADSAADFGLPLSVFSEMTTAKLADVLPTFATKTNPVDVTAALLTDSSLFGRVLPILSTDDSVGACLIGIPVAGRGYDVERFAKDVAMFEQQAHIPIVVVAPQDVVATEFVAKGIVVFSDESEAVGALAQYLHHHDMIALAKKRQFQTAALWGRVDSPTSMLNEANSLTFLSEIGVPVIPFVLTQNPTQAAEAFDQLGGHPVVVKGCSSDVSHKSDLGLVEVDVRSSTDVHDVAERMIAAMAAADLVLDGVIVAAMAKGQFEGLLGAHADPVFGPVVLVGAGGVYVEALPDVQLLMPPFDKGDALRAISRLRVAPILEGVRGQRPVNIDAWAAAAVNLGNAMLEDSLGISSIDINPLMLMTSSDDDPGLVLAVDAVVIRRLKEI